MRSTRRAYSYFCFTRYYFTGKAFLGLADGNGTER